MFKLSGFRICKLIFVPHTLILSSKIVLELQLFKHFYFHLETSYYIGFSIPCRDEACEISVITRGEEL